MLWAKLPDTRGAVHTTHLAAYLSHFTLANISLSELRQQIQHAEISTLAHSLLNDDDPWLFRGTPGSYTQFKREVRLGLQDVNIDCLVVGSAKYGYSIAPDTFGRTYREQSDIDVAICSAPLFEMLWHKLLDWKYPWHLRRLGDQRDWGQEIMENHFGGAVDPSSLKIYSQGARRVLPQVREFSQRWFDTFQRLGAAGPARGRVVEGRIYHSVNHLNRYLETGLRSVRLTLS